MKTHSNIGRLGSVVTMIVFLLLACSTPTQSPPASSGTASADTKPYGSVVVAWSSKIDAVDPTIQPNASAYPGLLVGVLDSLIVLDPDDRIKPSLAERWEISADGLTQTFYIRKGVKFHDGSDLTGADVKFSMERVLGPGVTALFGSAAWWRSMAPQVELKDDYTVVVRFKTPQFLVAKATADYGGHLAVLPKKYIEEKGIEYFRKNPIGSGPWKVTNFVPGERIELEANESYWDKTMVPKFKNLTALYVPEDGTKVAMLKTGEVDAADVSAESAVALKKAGMKIKAWDGGQQPAFMPLYDIKNPAQHPFGDVRVRKALSFAINRKELADNLFSGYAEPGIVFRVQRTFDFFPADVLKADPHDPEGAKKLMAEAGYPNGFDTKVWDTGGGGILSLFNQALTGYWRKVGINAALEPIQTAALVPIITSYSDARVWNTVFATGVGTSVGAGTTQFDIAPAFHSKKSFFRNHLNTKLDNLIDEYEMTKDAAERKRIAREATILAHDEYSAISVLILQTTWALSSKIGDFTPIQGWAHPGAAYITMTHAK